MVLTAFVSVVLATWLSINVSRGVKTIFATIISPSFARNVAEAPFCERGLQPVAHAEQAFDRPPKSIHDGRIAAHLYPALHQRSREVRKGIEEMVKEPDPQLRYAPHQHLTKRPLRMTHDVSTVWFQHYRKDYFHDDALPAGKWSKRESKQNWRVTYLQTLRNREREPLQFSRPITPASNYASGQQTPREIREEKWRQEAEAQSKPTKLEMREMYKELGGRKARGKGKVGATGGARDKGGWGEYAGGFDDY